MGKFSRLGNELYTGQRSIDFIGRKGLFYLISAVLVLAACTLVVFKTPNFGIEFTGGTKVSVPLPANQVTQDNADLLREVVADSGFSDSEAVVTTSGNTSILVQTEELTNDEARELVAQLAEEVGADPADLSVSEIGSKLGSQVAERAVLGVVIFLFLVVLFIWAYFREWKMSIAALIALFHDIALTAGVYALSGFSVTPAAVTGLLAILGFSLYDTVVVFDKVRENANDMKRSRLSYAQAANLAVNQTLVRSINTAVVALIPIGAILYVSAVQLGASSLQDLALSQFVGMGVGVYSSIFLAPRVLVQMKSNETEVKLAERRAKARAKAAADKYAAVPAFSEGMPVGDDPDSGRFGRAIDDDLEYEDDGDDGAGGGAVAPPRTDRPVAPDSGRTTPKARGEVSESRSSGRPQPKRKPKSQRGK